MNIRDYKDSESFVKSILAEKPETRGDDWELLMAVWEKQGLKLTDDQKKMLRKCHPAETITRARRATQATGLYRPDRNVFEQRSLLEEGFRKHFGKNEE